ncbi:hypothetical protein Oweho_0468 [Owenweeksia hongkongensis DSM 17368]|uniref:Uncharacterized protein n=1 Tax=Owenweeksia hongkongensis (strain DSM 17368 / CIP 108786 / JCM 12287 / NRRL B-23963 / UST20020801) TaxID=926562 RepID=G8QZA3_OWEHD|nr:hypothetical protein Oweho_0468 [Owenweeksia hongkongensis DSM 17368]
MCPEQDLNPYVFFLSLIINCLYNNIFFFERVCSPLIPRIECAKIMKISELRWVCYYFLTRRLILNHLLPNQIYVSLLSAPKIHLHNPRDHWGSIYQEHKKEILHLGYENDTSHRVSRNKSKTKGVCTGVFSPEKVVVSVLE